MSNTLLVPITLDVLLANTDLRGRDSFRRWEYRYDNLLNDTFESPEPTGFDKNGTNKRTGAFLHWTLPRALRTSRPGSSSEYPLVPNRWLVVRTCRDPASPSASAKAWVVESDCPATGRAGTSASSFMVAEKVKTSWEQSTDPNRLQAKPTPVTSLNSLQSPDDSVGTGAYIQSIGQFFDLDSWQEQAADVPLFLTAVAPGNLEFSAYVLFNSNVFSFYDDLTGVPDISSLSYQVIGWYSDPAQDIVAPAPAGSGRALSSAAVLRALDWTLIMPADELKNLELGTSLYTGLAWGLSWNKNAAAPMPDQLWDVGKTANMTVAVANTSVDAFTTLVGSQLAQDRPTLKSYAGKPEKVIELLRAFHYDLLPLLNQAKIGRAHV